VSRVVLYAVGPVDHWGGWIDLEKHDVSEFADDYDGTEPARLTKQVANLLDAAKLLALDHGWEGDMRQGPFLAAIPNDDNGIDLVVGWKQDNNGTTFFGSSIELSHLGRPKGSTTY
jgi:hypothetical protein